MNERTRVDPVMLFATLLLVGIGVVMVYSASAVFAQKQTGDGFYYFKRQLVNVVFGLAALVFGFRLGIERFCKCAYPLLLTSVVLLLLVIIPGIGSRVGGSARWISLGLINFQPAELAKISFVLYLAFSLTRKREQIQAFSIGFLPHLIVTSVFVFLLLSQPDFGTATTLTMILFLMLYVAGTRFSYIAISALAALPMAYGLIVGSEYRMRRLLAFLDPWADRYDVGYHITESLMSFGSGGIFGVGLGEGKHKLFFLPAIHTDFIFSLIGEELGLVGTLFVIALFGILVWRGMLAAWRAPDLFGTYLAFGLTTLIALQIVINFGVVTGLLPTKGLTLPLVSYGGSSMICTLFGIGILLRISATGRKRQAATDSKVTWP